jgi:hypothetical protein
MDPSLISFLMNQGGPILRWRTARELTPDDLAIDRESLFADLLACDEVHRWLNLLGSGPVHHSKDSSAENVLAKLAEYGLQAGLAELDERVLPYCAIEERQPYHDEAIILVPFLVRLGYHDILQVANWLAWRIEVLYQLAASMDYDLYINGSFTEARNCSINSISITIGMYWAYPPVTTCTHCLTCRKLIHY